MSSTENHNGTTPLTNGIKSSSTIAALSATSSMPNSTATSTTISSSNSGPVGIRNSSTVATNSSFLYSSGASVTRDRPRQAPPPTLPKYTSSFNAGSNGTAERLSRERETGNSYRLASLDRLALKQRILDSEKANGADPNSVRNKLDSSHFIPETHFQLSYPNSHFYPLKPSPTIATSLFARSLPRH